MRFHKIITAAIGSAAIVAAAKTRNEPINARGKLPEGYTIQPLVWRGAIEDGGPELTFNGTIEQITQEIKAIKRDFTWKSLPQAPKKRSKRVSETLNINCGLNNETTSDSGSLSVVNVLADKLQATSGNCVVPAGPKVCSVIASETPVAVWLCNDNTQVINPPCNSLARFVSEIYLECGCIDSDFRKGQIFNPQGWNVIVDREGGW